MEDPSGLPRYDIGHDLTCAECSGTPGSLSGLFYSTILKESICNVLNDDALVGLVLQLVGHVEHKARAIIFHVAVHTCPHPTLLSSTEAMAFISFF